MEENRGRNLKMYFEEMVKKFNEENPEIAAAIKLFDISQEQYYQMMTQMPAEVIVTTSVVPNNWDHQGDAGNGNV
jgi:Lhr-like helicase